MTAANTLESYATSVVAKNKEIADLWLVEKLNEFGFPHRYDTVTFNVCGENVIYEWFYDASDPHGGWRLKA